MVSEMLLWDSFWVEVELGLNLCVEVLFGLKTIPVLALLLSLLWVDLWINMDVVSTNSAEHTSHLLLIFAAWAPWSSLLLSVTATGCFVS